MIDTNIYKEIAERTNGDIYIGVVGPVRSGKSTFISKFMNTMVLPQIEEGSRKQRIIDEMPQAGDGKVIMTTQIKFVPDNGVQIKLDKNNNCNIRLIDCVGYPYEGVGGFFDANKERKIVTPWSDEEMNFSDAARYGTEKVMVDHSTIGIVVISDGSIINEDRKNFEKEEEEVINKMKSLNKPFVIILNTREINDSNIALKESLEQKYEMPILLKNISMLTSEDFKDILNAMLMQFPIKFIDIKMPSYLQALPKDSHIIKNIVNKIVEFMPSLKVMDDYKKLDFIFENDDNLEQTIQTSLFHNIGKIEGKITPRKELFYKVLSEQSNENIENEFKLVSYIKELSEAKKEYDKIKDALLDVREYGYGIVTPTNEDMEFFDPEIVKKGNKCAIKLRANAASYHIMRVDVQTEVNPMISSEMQNEDTIHSWLDDFNDEKNSIWKSNMFGKSLETLAKDGVSTKVMNIPEEVKMKLRKTLSRIVNEGKGGVLCVLL